MKKSLKNAIGTVGAIAVLGAAGAYIFGSKLFSVGCSRYDGMKHLWGSGLHAPGLGRQAAALRCSDLSTKDAEPDALAETDLAVLCCLCTERC